eukprot:294897-Pleurochrysis_carterae.AAC.1
MTMYEQKDPHRPTCIARKSDSTTGKGDRMGKAPTQPSWHFSRDSSARLCSRRRFLRTQISGATCMS